MNATTATRIAYHNNRFKLTPFKDQMVDIHGWDGKDGAKKRKSGINEYGEWFVQAYSRRHKVWVLFDHEGHYLDRYREERWF